MALVVEGTCDGRELRRAVAPSRVEDGPMVGRQEVPCPVEIHPILLVEKPNAAPQL